jgi:serine/threonine-protein kinase
MAEVFEAHDEKRQRAVALKIMRRSLAREPEAVSRLQREALVQEMIQHPNVARIYGGGVTERAEPYLVVELLRGRTLRHVLKKQGRVDLVRAASYAWQALQGLAAIHEVGVFHRDLKPANLMLEPSSGPVERVVLIDFGFATLEGSSRLTTAGHVVGSLAYLSPERLQGEVGDARSDLYAVGIILYELLAGQRPFVADSDLDLIGLQLETEPVPPSQAVPGLAVPPAVEAVIMKALEKRPEHRCATAAAMARELEAAMQRRS